MSKTPFLYIASWKMYLSFKQSHAWVNHNHAALKTLGKDFSIIICPSFDALSTLKHDLQGTHISLGAQNCSEHKPGPYTGQVLAESLIEIGCTYCIIGHSETRKAFNETTESIAQKALRLLSNGITPIICIGETARDYEMERTTQVLEEELNALLKTIPASTASHKKIIIGYEPTWAIDGATPPSFDYIRKQILLIKKILTQKIPSFESKVLYGGSVTELTIQEIKNVDELDGVMIGHASIDFQSFEKIVIS